MRRMDGTIVAVAAAASALAFAGPAAAASCESLNGKTFGDATIAKATAVAAPFSVMNVDPPQPVAVDKPFCRVEGVLKPSADSDIKFEVWLPPATAWNGKYQGVGNGGFAGSLIYGAMVWALDGGYAVSGTDTGHAGGSLESAWALGHPEKIKDFGWRGVHETALASKAVVEAYYEKAPARSYFRGCSDGGREALMEAQRFPRDYEGIVAGAPANAWTKLLIEAIWDEQALAASPDAWLSPEKLALVSKATVAACHGENGVIADPRQCRFDPAGLQCKSGQADVCLTAPELATLKKIYAGPQDSAGKGIFPGLAPGGEAGPSAWSLWVTGGEPKRNLGSLIYFFGTGFFSNMVYDKPDWDFRTLDLAKGLADASQKTGEALDATETDLGPFKAAGGKLIQYHGWNDSAISPTSSINYYESVAAKMGGIESIQSFYRLFMAPGMEHCGGGPGPNAVGGAFGLPPPSRDPAHDVTSALEHWVEDGVAPGEITATLYRDNDPSKGIASQRTWRAYPTTAP
jgi:Tannase and feruloyl esterase